MNKTIFLFCCLFLCFIRAGAKENQEIPKIWFQHVNSQEYLDSLLYQVEKQSGYRFVYTKKWKKPSGKMIFVGAIRKELEKSKTVSEILNNLIGGRYSHAIFDECKTVFIYKKEVEEIPKFTIEFNNQPLDSALCQIEQQSGYKFLYQDKIAGEPVKINRTIKDKTISETLGTLLAETGYDYFISSRSVIIYKKVEAKPILITGKVVDEFGSKLIGVSIYIKGEEGVYTITDTDGSFAISTTNPNAYLIVSYVGFLQQVVPVKNAGLIKLEENTEALKEIL